LAPSPGHESGFYEAVPGFHRGRARFIEDLILEQLEHGVGQYVILGASSAQ
jgi:O-methyltransferase involved in polyketide biosynthesis